MRGALLLPLSGPCDVARCAPVCAGPHTERGCPWKSCVRNGGKGRCALLRPRADVFLGHATWQVAGRPQWASQADQRPTHHRALRPQRLQTCAVRIA